MPIHHIITHRCELTAPLTVTPLRHALSSGDERGDRFEVTVTRGGQPVALDGASVQAYFLRASDGGTVALTGSAEGNVAVLELPEACYAVPGRFTLTVKVSVGDARHAVYVAEGAVLRASTEEIIDPGHSVPDLGELLARIAQLEAVTAEGQQAAAAAGTAATSATAAAKSAHDAAASANTAKENADKATSSANTAASGATNAAQSANTAASAANTARTNADKATAAAKTAVTEATAAAKTASDKAAELQRQADSGDFDGATFTPEVSASGVLSWTNDRGLDNPPPVSIKGEKGDKGEPGAVTAWNGIEPDETGNVTAAIGGRNLLRDTGTFAGWVRQPENSQSYGSVEVTGPGTVFVRSFDTGTVRHVGMKTFLGAGYYADYAGKTLSVSFDVMSEDWEKVADGNYTGLNSVACQIGVTTGTPESGSFGSMGGYYYARLGNPAVVIGADAPVENGRWRRIVLKPFALSDAVWTSNKDKVGPDYPGLVFQFAVRMNGAVHFRRFKIESGSVATDWSPAPEDKQDALVGAPGQVVGFDADGKAVAESLTVGGRNLALGSRGEFITASNAETNKLGVALPLSDDGRQAVAPVGAGILISYEARADVPGQKMYYSLRRADSETSSTTLQIVSLTTDYRRYCFRGKTTLEGSLQVIPLIYKASDGAGGVTGKVYIRNVKVELGDVPTDWSPAPEDPAPSAEKLSAAHQITLSGDVTGSASFDGSGDASISATLRDIGVGISAGLRYGPDTTTVSAGYGGKLIVPRFLLDSKGRVVSADNATVTLPAYPTGVESAGRLATPRKINGVAFDGSKDITVSDEALAARVQTLEERLAALESRKE